MDPSISLSPQKFREIVFQLVYSSDFGGDADLQEMLMSQLSVTKRIIRAAEGVKNLLLEKKEQIDGLIIKHSQSYDLERIPRVERNIVRLGIYELLFSPQVPPKVVIAESMRLARKFATAESSTFVNALMDSIYQSLDKKDEVFDEQLTSSRV